MKAAETSAEKVAVAQANSDWSIPALWVFVAAYVMFGTITWFVYLRRSFATRRVPSLAHETICTPGRRPEGRRPELLQLTMAETCSA